MKKLLNAYSPDATYDPVEGYKELRRKELLAKRDAGTLTDAEKDELVRTHEL